MIDEAGGSGVDDPPCTCGVVDQLRLERKRVAMARRPDTRRVILSVAGQPGAMGLMEDEQEKSAEPQEPEAKWSASVVVLYGRAYVRHIGH